MRFEDLGLSSEILRAIDDAGYEAPTPIQEQAVPYVLMNRDILACAQTGTGKTASFVVPMLDILAAGRARARMPRSLILEPTRELAAQVADNFETYGKYQKLSMALLIGGVSFEEQEKRLDRGVDVLIATPGRLLDHFERGKVLLSDVKILVIDEADRMLDMGFIPDVERIVKLLPKIRQTLMLSATMPKEIKRLADQFLMNPKEITVNPESSTADTVEQSIMIVAQRDKREALRTLMRAEDVSNALIFCNRKRDIGVLHRSLKRHGFEAGALHGDMDQFSRMDTLKSFKDGDIKYLVCSDVAARGLDIAGMSHVFNFDVPTNAEDYVHRIGRTGRAGKSGRAITLATGEDGKYVAAIERITGGPIPRMAIDGVDEAEIDTSDDGKRRRRRSSRKSPSESRGSGRQAAKRSAPSDRKESKSRSQREETEQKETEKKTSGRKKAARSKQDERPAAEKAKSKPSKGGSEPMQGFGDDVPAFMLRPVKISS